MNAKATIGFRIFLGLIYFVFGWNGYFGFIPMPPMPPEAGAFLGGLFSAPYFIHILKPTEIICGALLLAGKAVPFALVVLAPITLNILLFHVFFTPGGWPMSAVMMALQVALMYNYRARYKPLFN
jgi:putative oxidoreductase